MPDVADADLQMAVGRLQALLQQVQQVIFGQQDVVEHLLITLLCGGHALLEGVPGTAKTLMVRTLAAAMSCRSKRISFTPDLMPSDILGTNVFDARDSSFHFHEGPLFTDILLADEINRAPAKTQSALLEAMSERHATVDGVRYALSPIFAVFATQNPVEFEGTYPLPEAQQDRFLLKVKVPYPQESAELSLLDAVNCGQPPDRRPEQAVQPVLDVASVLAVQAALPRVRMETSIVQYVLKIIRATRAHGSILVGAGPRGSIYLLQAAKARALLQGRDYATPDDVVSMAGPVLAHRMTLAAEAEVSGATREQVLQSIVETIEVPR